jgi:hypothetical protein
MAEGEQANLDKLDRLLRIYQAASCVSYTVEVHACRFEEALAAAGFCVKAHQEVPRDRPGGA